MNPIPPRPISSQSHTPSITHASPVFDPTTLFITVSLRSFHPHPPPLTPSSFSPPSSSIHPKILPPNPPSARQISFDPLPLPKPSFSDANSTVSYSPLIPPSALSSLPFPSLRLNKLVTYDKSSPPAGSIKSPSAPILPPRPPQQATDDQNERSTSPTSLYLQQDPLRQAFPK